MIIENEILEHMNKIETLKQWIQTKEAAIKDGSKRTGKPLSASSIKGYTSTINVWSRSIKHSEAEIERLKNSRLEPTANASVETKYREAYRKIGELEGVKGYLEKKIVELNGKIDDWEEWYKRQDRRPPMNKSEIPQGWHVVIGGVQG